MSKTSTNQVQQLQTEELVDFALEHLGAEHEALRQAALQEYLSRVKDAPNTLVAPAGDVKLLRAKLSELKPPA